MVSQRDDPIKGERRIDFMQAVLDMRSRSKSNINEDTIVGHALSLLLDGFETSSIMMTYCLYQLAVNLDIQKQIQAEIDTSLEEYGNDGKLTEECVHSMEYLEQTLYGNNNFIVVHIHIIIIYFIKFVWFLYRNFANALSRLYNESCMH